MAAPIRIDMTVYFIKFFVEFLTFARYHIKQHLGIVGMACTIARNVILRNYDDTECKKHQNIKQIFF